MWTLVNIGASTVNGSQLVIPYQAGMVYYHLWHGVELKPVVNNGTAALAFSIEGNGYGVILGTKPSDRPANLTAFLATMRKLTAKPLSSYSAANTVLTQTINPTLTSKLYSEPSSGMVAITTNICCRCPSRLLKNGLFCPATSDGSDSAELAEVLAWRGAALERA